MSENEPQSHKCPDCGEELNIPKDAMNGELISCPSCGLDLEIKITEGKTEVVEINLAEYEDGGE